MTTPNKPTEPGFNRDCPNCKHSDSYGIPDRSCKIACQPTADGKGSNWVALNKPTDQPSQQGVTLREARDASNILKRGAAELRLFDSAQSNTLRLSAKVIDDLIAEVERLSQPTAPERASGEQAYTTGHCKEKAKPGGCQLHNLHCGYPACDRKPAVTPTAEPAGEAVPQGWVPVGERMPEPDTGEVLVWLTSSRCAFDEWHTHREDPTGMGGPTMDMGLMWRDYEFEDITHWMPLPAEPGSTSPAAPEAAKPSGDMSKYAEFWERLPGHLIDNHEGEELTEEMLQRAAADLWAKFPDLAASGLKPFGLLLLEERATTSQLVRALREATETPTFMGEPVRAAKHEQQAQAGEPEVVASVAEWPDDLQRTGLVYEVPREELPAGTQLITLQSHREALQDQTIGYEKTIDKLNDAFAKKDAAFQALAEQGATAEKQALEEAAQKMDEMYKNKPRTPNSSYIEGYSDALDYAEQAIRSLIK